MQRGPSADQHWFITKRYSDFANLDAILRLSGIELPLPPKRVFGKMEREFIAERQQGLQVTQYDWDCSATVYQKELFYSLCGKYSC